MTVEGVVAALALAAVVYVVYAAGSRAADGTERAFRGYFRGHRPDPWPVGVQEEDRDRRWGVDSLPATAAEPDVPSAAVAETEELASTTTGMAPLQRVSPRVGTRRAASLSG